MYVRHRVYIKHMERRVMYIFITSLLDLPEMRVTCTPQSPYNYTGSVGSCNLTHSKTIQAIGMLKTFLN